MAPVPIIRARIPGSRIMRPSGTTQAVYKTPVTHFSLVRFAPGNKLEGYEYEERPLCPLVLTDEDRGGGHGSGAGEEGDDETTHVSETEYDDEEEGGEEEGGASETEYNGEDEEGDGAQPDPLLMLSSAAVSSSGFPPAQLRPATVKRHIYIVKDSDDEADGPSEEVVEEDVV